MDMIGDLEPMCPGFESRGWYDFFFFFFLDFFYVFIFFFFVFFCLFFVIIITVQIGKFNITVSTQFLLLYYSLWCPGLQRLQRFDFFHCRYYQVQRIELLNSVSQYQTPSLSLLLHGNDSFSLGTNTVIFEKVHKFIMDSKRFWEYYPLKSKRLVLSLSVLEIFVFDATVSANPRPSSIFSSMVCKSLFSFFFLDLSLSLSLSLSL